MTKADRDLAIDVLRAGADAAYQGHPYPMLYARLEFNVKYDSPAYEAARKARDKIQDLRPDLTYGDRLLNAAACLEDNTWD